MLTTAVSGTKYRGKLKLFRKFRDGLLLKRLGLTGKALIKLYGMASRLISPTLKNNMKFRKLFLRAVVAPAAFLLERLGQGR